MEEIIIAMLYLYPGALVDLIRKTLLKKTYRADDLNESTRIAKYFWFSTLISVVALLVYGRCAGKSISNPEDIQRALAGTMEIPKYFGISLAVTVVFTGILEGLKWLVVQIRSCGKRKNESAVYTQTIDAWHEVYYGEDLEDIRGYLVLRITNGDKIKAGFSLFLPEDYEDGILLTRQNEVEAAFEQDKGKGTNDPSRLIFGPVLTYYDSKTGALVEFFNGYNLSKTLI